MRSEMNGDELIYLKYYLNHSGKIIPTMFKSKWLQSFIIFGLFIFIQNSYGQTKFGVYILPGVNTIIYRGDFPAESYWPKFAFSVGGFTDIKLFKTNFSIQTGLQYSNRSFDMNVNRQSWTEIINSLELPVLFHYSYKNWLNPNIGFINSFNFGQNEHVNPYALGFIVGVDFIVWKKLILGYLFTFDITPVMTQGKIDKIFYYRHFNGIKLGYLF